MHIETHGSNIAISPDLERHAEMCVWRAVQRHRRRVSWACVQFTGFSGPGEPHRTMCQIDVWHRGSGPVTISHTDPDPSVAADLAAARLGQALQRLSHHRRRGSLAPMQAGTDLWTAQEVLPWTI